MLFAPVAGKVDGVFPVVRRLDIKDEAVQPLPWLLESTFAFEMVRTRAGYYAIRRGLAALR
jgi:hypothetical protein